MHAAFRDCDEIGLRMVTRVANNTGLGPDAISVANTRMNVLT